MIDMTVPVLYKSMLIKNSQELSIDLIRDLIPFVDEKSIRVLDKVMHSSAFEEPPQKIREIETLEILNDLPLSQIVHEVEKQGFVPASLNSCLYFLSALKGRLNTDIRRYFFADGKIILSSLPIVIDGELNFLAIGQDQCQMKHHQKPFSIRLLASQKNFLHSLYKVIVAKV